MKFFYSMDVTTVPSIPHICIPKIQLKYPSNSDFSRLQTEILALKDLKTKLYDYQINTLLWMRKHPEQRGILGLHMGMGKTLIILVHYLLNNNKKFLYICPKNISIQLNEYIATHLTDEARSKIGYFTSNSRINPQWNFLIATYGKISSLYNQEITLDYLPDVIILDESQVIRNASTRVAKACKALAITEHMNQKWLLSGTCIVNKLRDLLSQLSFLEIDYTTDWREKYYISFDQKILIHKLPECYIYDIRINMTNEQLKVYQKYRQQLIAEIHRSHWTINEYVIAKMCYMKQIAIHPDLIDSTSTSTNINHNPFKININIDFSPIQPSNKFLEIKWLLLHAINETHQVIIYSQYTKALSLLNKYLKQIGYTDTELLIGHTSNKGTVISNFRGGKFRILLCNILSCGTGLNLQNANVVIFLDHWWNSVLEKQAIARVYRLGQEKCVKIFRLTTNQSIETYLLEQKYHKNVLIDNIHNGTAINRYNTKLLIRHILDIYVKETKELKFSSYVPYETELLVKLKPIVKYLQQKILDPESNYIQNYFKQRYPDNYQIS